MYAPRTSMSLPTAAGTHLVVPARSVVAPTRVFRGDGRKPPAVFAEGFHVPCICANVDLKSYGLRNTRSPWVGYSKKENQAAMFPQTARGSTWVYEVDRPGTGIDVNRALGYGYLFRNEREVIFLHDMPPSRIRRAVWWSWGMPTSRVVDNPDYVPFSSWRC